MSSPITRVILRTRAAAPLAAFYETLLGLERKADADDDAQGLTHLRHPVSGQVLLTLVESPQAPDAPRQAPGLFHIALLFPELEGWKAALHRLFAMPGLDFHGASDHGVSWAVYLADPDGNGVELAWDKPESEWPWRGDRIQMVSHALPLRSILAQPSAAASKLTPAVHIGHLHLQSAHLSDADAYLKKLDLRVTQDSYSGAVFMARGNYHHHLAVNIWNTRPDVARPKGATGLVGWDMTVPGAGDVKGTVWIDPAGAEVKIDNRAEGSEN